MTLSEFILARIAEDEALAEAAKWKDQMGEWGTLPEHADEVEALENAWHPFRVLAECDAKRRIMADHMLGFSETLSGDVVTSRSEFCSRCAYGDDAWRWPCPTMVALALPYTDHPDYRDEWKPW